MKRVYLVEVATDKHSEFDVHSVMLVALQAVQESISGKIKVKVLEDKDINKS
jgi:hypothetical protein